MGFIKSILFATTAILNFTIAFLGRPDQILVANSRFVVTHLSYWHKARVLFDVKNPFIHHQLQL
jgi:hypothetical protein